MKKVLVAVMLVAFAASAALAADTVVLKAKNGDVSFNHKAHSGKIDCKTCHGDAAPGKMTLGKEKAHALCKDCHSKQNGPTKCADCHKK